MQLELGKRYVQRDGMVTGNIEQSKSFVFPFMAKVGGVVHSWRESGSYAIDERSHEWDIVSEYAPDPEVQLTPVNLTADDLEAIRQHAIETWEPGQYDEPDEDEPDVIPGPGVRKRLFRYRTRYDDNEPWQDWSYVTATDLDTVMRWMLSIPYIFRNIEINLVAESFGEL